MTISHDLTFHTAPGTTDGNVTGRNATSKDSFFGGTPAAQPTVPATGATVQNVVDALVALNLVKPV
jgi:hypothetical protein